MPHLIGWLDDSFYKKLSVGEVIYWTAQDASGKVVVEIYNHKVGFKMEFNLPDKPYQYGTAKTLEKAKRFAEGILKRNGFRLIDPKIMVMK